MLNDQQQDKQAARSQLIGFVLLGLLMLLFLNSMNQVPQEPPLPTDAPQAQTAPQGPGAARAATPSGTPDPPPPPVAPYLPPIPENIRPELDFVSLNTPELEMTFTRIGARLRKAVVLLGADGENSINLVPDSDPDELTSIYPLALEFTQADIGAELNNRRWEVEDLDDGAGLAFSIVLPGRARITKTYRTDPEHPHLISLTVGYENLTSSKVSLGIDRTPAYFVTWSPEFSSHDEQKGLRKSFIWRQEGDNDSIVPAKMEQETGVLSGFMKQEWLADWAALKSAYFMAAMKPEFEGGSVVFRSGENWFEFGLTVPSHDIAPASVVEHTIQFYIGPNEMKSLKKAWPTLETAQRFFESVAFMDWFAKALLSLLNLFYSLIPNYGIAIILLTVVVRTVMFPLTLKSMRSMKGMQQLAPEMERLRAEHADDPNALNQKMMEMYKERGINPMGGCWPMFLQMPVFFALYRMLWNAFELRGAPFVSWIHDLSEPDRLVQIPGISNVPVIGTTFEYLNVIPILMGLAMVLSMKIAPTTGPSQNPQQKMIMTIMPIFFSFICYNMASGLNLYILTSTILGMVQSKFTHAAPAPEPKEIAEKKKKRKQNFYAAAQARNREAKKAQRIEKRKEQRKQPDTDK